MEQALYGPDGYYASGRARSGKAGDYFTAPDTGPVFGRLLAAIFSHWQTQFLAEPFELVEVGAGEGALAGPLVAALGSGRFRYTAVERSPARREALQRLSHRPHALRVLPDLSALQAEPIRGCLFANELIDAFPVHRVRMRAGKLQEAYVDNKTFDWAEPSTPALEAYLSRLKITLPEGYETEINLAMADWIRAAADSLEQGWVVVIDYGRPAQEYYQPERRTGTLRAFRDHRLADDVLAAPAETDLTADVDFTSLALDARAAGLAPLAFQEMGTFLLEGAHRLGEVAESDRRALRYLVHPEGMGAQFHVLILGKQVPASWTIEHNRLHRLGIS